MRGLSLFGSYGILDPTPKFQSCTVLIVLYVLYMCYASTLKCQHHSEGFLHMNLQSEGGRFSRFAEVLLGFIEEYVGLYVYLKCGDVSTIFPKGQFVEVFHRS